MTLAPSPTRVLSRCAVGDVWGLWLGLGAQIWPLIQPWECRSSLGFDDHDVAVSEA
jgi:hypothetical protein